jgi:cytochrome c oxidase subunit 3/cytochrome o ubiquinol oxidase subunit 3
MTSHNLRGRVGMACVILSEGTFFTIFIVAYLHYLGRSLSGPTPAQVLHLPIAGTVCLLASSLTVGFAVRALRAGETRRFALWWLATLLLGAAFLVGTGVEWHRLIWHEGLTIGTNLFGTTYYSLVGFHAGHVFVGLVALGLVFVLTTLGRVARGDAERVELLSWYWHFVDAVWVAVLTVVYVVGR